MRRNFLRNNDANLAFFFIFIVISVITIFLFTFASPFMADFLSYSYNIGQDLLQDAEDQVNQIEDNTTREDLQDALESAQETTASQISLMTNFYKYAWAFIISIVSLVMFVVARSWVEYERRGGVV